MEIYIGLIDKETGLRHVLFARTMPNLRDLQDLTMGGLSADIVDWGVAASEQALGKLACILLEAHLQHKMFGSMVPEFVDRVLKGLSSTSIWLLTSVELKAWMERGGGVFVQ